MPQHLADCNVLQKENLELSLLFLKVCCIGFLPSVVSLGCDVKRSSLDVPLSFSFLCYVGLCILTACMRFRNQSLIMLQKSVLRKWTGFVKSHEG